MGSIIGLFLSGLLWLVAGLSRAKVASNEHSSLYLSEPKNRHTTRRAGREGGFSEEDACVCESECSLEQFERKLLNRCTQLLSKSCFLLSVRVRHLRCGRHTLDVKSSYQKDKLAWSRRSWSGLCYIISNVCYVGILRYRWIAHELQVGTLLG